MISSAFISVQNYKSENDYVVFERDYHYEIYRRPELRKYFGDFRDNSVLFGQIEDQYDILQPCTGNCGLIIGMTARICFTTNCRIKISNIY